MNFSINIVEFLTESRRIEGLGSPGRREIECTRAILELNKLIVADISNYVNVTTDGQAQIRAIHGMDVRVGNYIPPRGGPGIVTDLADLLADIGVFNYHPYEGHIHYEDLHPYTDGNGRSGRLIWLWAMKKRNLPVYNSSFLHTWYYQSLEDNK